MRPTHPHIIYIQSTFGNVAENDLLAVVVEEMSEQVLLLLNGCVIPRPMVETAELLHYLALKLRTEGGRRLTECTSRSSDGDSVQILKAGTDGSTLGQLHAWHSELYRTLSACMHAIHASPEEEPK